MEGVSVPEAPLVAANEPDVTPLVGEVGFPHQGAVAEDPQAALPGQDVLRLHSEHGLEAG